MATNTNTAVQHVVTKGPRQSLADTEAHLAQQLGRQPTPDELAKRLKDQEYWRYQKARERRPGLTREQYAVLMREQPSEGSAGGGQPGANALPAPTTALPPSLPTLDAIDRQLRHLEVLRSAVIAAREAEKAKAGIAALAEVASARREAAVRAEAAAISAAAAKHTQALEQVSRLSAAAPLHLEEDEELGEEDFWPFKHMRSAYMRYGWRESSGEVRWEDQGDLWRITKEGLRGEYVGRLKADGSIDSSAEVLNDEPEIK